MSINAIGNSELSFAQYAQTIVTSSMTTARERQQEEIIAAGLQKSASSQRYSRDRVMLSNSYGFEGYTSSDDYSKFTATNNPAKTAVMNSVAAKVARPVEESEESDTDNTTGETTAPDGTTSTPSVSMPNFEELTTFDYNKYAKDIVDDIMNKPSDDEESLNARIAEIETYAKDFVSKNITQYVNNYASQNQMAAMLAMM